MKTIEQLTAENAELRKKLAAKKARKKRKPYGNPCRSCKGLFGHHHWFCQKPE